MRIETDRGHVNVTIADDEFANALWHLRIFMRGMRHRNGYSSLARSAIERMDADAAGAWARAAATYANATLRMLDNRA